MLLTGCATLPTGVADSDCRQQFEALDQRIESANVRDGGAHRIEGFPYLRVNRFLASLRNEAPFMRWAERLRALDMAARVAELKNLGEREALKTLDACGKKLLLEELRSAETQQQVRERAQVPDDYSALARTAGLYPLAVPFLSLGVNGYQKEIRRIYAKPLDELLAQPRTHYRAVAQAHPHAPVFSVETRGDADRIGSVEWRDGLPHVNTSRPTVYYERTQTRFGARTLQQIVYTAWFAERPKQSSLDPYAGALDGIVWRVTLDEQGRPLTYDTIHPCGCYHHWFPAQALKIRSDLDDSADPPLLPQAGFAPSKPLLLVDSGTHFVSRLIPQSHKNGKKAVERVAYELRPYSDLLTLADGKGGTRSLFGADGLVAGSERGERWWLWVTGVNSPGAMRQSGRQATAFIGRRHFDDARILETVFVP